MKMQVLGISLVFLMGQGCGPIGYATRTLVVEPWHFCQSLDSLQEMHRNYQLAKEQWNAFLHADPDHGYSADYAAGFQDGFADYLYAGGTGEPPPLPPRPYWRIGYESPQGHEAIADWFAGFRHGAAVAQQSGYRQWVTVPTSLAPRISGEMSAVELPPSHPEPATESVLPMPRAVPMPAEGLQGTAPAPASAVPPAAAGPTPGPSGAAAPAVRVILPPQG
ncbi:MAG TPA: hypothetical protein VKU02_23465 [Gemmataceae bacterium]|nr:hypothetical protein [Gemmataceae bacterium]